MPAEPRSARLDRRNLLRGLAAASAGAGLAPLLTACGGAPASARADGAVWRNWSGRVCAQPRHFFHPASEHALTRLLRTHDGTIRPVGAGHSFSAVAASDQAMVDLSGLNGLRDIDEHAGIARLGAGSSISMAAEALFDAGSAFANQGDIDNQHIGGAIATATHGTGLAFGSFSDLVEGLRLCTADGEMVDIDANDPRLPAAATAVGALGITTEVRMRVQPRYRLAMRETTMPLDEVMQRAESLRDQHRHFEFFGFFGADTAIVKTLDPTEAEPSADGWPPLPVNTVLRSASEIVRAWPGSAHAVQTLLATLSGTTEAVDWAHRIFPSPREVRFNEMEYALPPDRALECLEALRHAVAQAGHGVLFPFEFRYVAGEESWLSPFHGGARAAISVHQYYRRDPQALFATAEPVLRRYGGRPHWGKIHSLGARELATLYPHWEDFQRLRREFDPRGRLLNPTLRKLFEPDPAKESL